MSKTIEFNETGEWTMNEAIELSMKEASMKAEVESMERSLKRCRELIENRGKKRAMKQGRKLSRSEREHAMKQAMMNWNE